MTGTNGAHVEVTTSWGPPAVTYMTYTLPLINGAVVRKSLRGIEEVLEPPTHCGWGHPLLPGKTTCASGHDEWDL